MMMPGTVRPAKANPAITARPGASVRVVIQARNVPMSRVPRAVAPVYEDSVQERGDELRIGQGSPVVGEGQAQIEEAWRSRADGLETTPDEKAQRRDDLVDEEGHEGDQDEQLAPIAGAQHPPQGG